MPGSAKQAGSVATADCAATIDHCELSTSQKSRTALLYAAQYATGDVMALLLSRGADLEAKDAVSASFAEP